MAVVELAVDVVVELLVVALLQRLLLAARQEHLLFQPELQRHRAEDAVAPAAVAVAAVLHQRDRSRLRPVC